MRKDSGYTRLLNILELGNRLYMLVAYVFVSIALVNMLFQTSYFLNLETRLLSLLTWGAVAFLTLAIIEIVSLLIIRKIESSDAHLNHTIGSRLAEIVIQLIIVLPVIMFETFGIGLNNEIVSFLATNLIPLVIIGVLLHASYTTFIQSEYHEKVWF